MRLLSFLLLAAACTTSSNAGDPAEDTRVPAARYTTARTTWAESVTQGISGVAPRGGDRFYAAPERDRYLLPFTVTSRGISVDPKVPLDGVPYGLDVEALAALPDGRLALGTEAKEDARVEDPILIARPGPGSVKVIGRITFSYAPFGIRAGGNRGVEALCFTDGRLLAAAETVIEREDARFAPLGSYDMEEAQWAYYRVRLTSDTGKLAGLACRRTEKNREVFAIERHYEVARILRFHLPLLDGGGDVHAEILVDLAPLFVERPPNFEAIEILEDGRFLLISDNDHGGVDGPTHLILVEPDEQRRLRPRPGAFVQ